MKFVKKLALPVFFLFFAGVCYPQSAPKAAASKPAAASKAQAAADSEVIPPVAPNALFPAVVARVNGKALLGRDLEQLVRSELASIGNPEWKDLREDYRGQLVMASLTTLINSRLLYDKATAAGVKATDAEVQNELKEISKSFADDAELNSFLASQHSDRATLEKTVYQRVVIQKYVTENVNNKVVVTLEELQKYYSSNPTQFHHPDIVRTSQIFIQPAGSTAEQDALARQRAEALLQRAQKGEDFAKLARENSVDPSASRGGDIGFYSKEALASEYGDAAFSLPVGGIKLVKSPQGYHIVKVTDKKKEGLATLEEVKEDLTRFLKEQKAQAELSKLVQQLRDQAKVEILIPAGQPLQP